MISKNDIKYIKSLQVKKQRQKYDQFVVEGEKSIKELLKSHFLVHHLFATSEWIASNLSELKSIKYTEVSEKELFSVSFHQTPQKALAIVNIPKYSINNSINNIVLGLDEIQDPGNLGTIIRIADWYGIKQIFCSKGCTDVFNPKCINATMGSFLRVNVIYEDLQLVAKTHQLPLISAVFNGEDVHGFKAPQKGMLIIGNEGHGISKHLIEQSEFKITIPNYGQAESLNAGISTAIILDNFKRNS